LALSTLAAAVVVVPLEAVLGVAASAVLGQQDLALRVQMQ
jgi:ABC-type sulfate transport system permease subunit